MTTQPLLIIHTIHHHESSNSADPIHLHLDHHIPLLAISHFLFLPSSSPSSPFLSSTYQNKTVRRTCAASPSSPSPSASSAERTGIPATVALLVRRLVCTCPSILYFMYTEQLNSLHREYRDSGTSSCIAQIQVKSDRREEKLIDELIWIGRLLSRVHLLRMLSDEAWEGVSFFPCYWSGFYLSRMCLTIVVSWRSRWRWIGWWMNVYLYDLIDLSLFYVMEDNQLQGNG